MTCYVSLDIANRIASISEDYPCDDAKTTYDFPDSFDIDNAFDYLIVDGEMVYDSLDKPDIKAIEQANAILNGTVQRTNMIAAAHMLDDSEIALLQPITEVWKSGHAYLEKEPVQHEGKMYQVMQAHTSQAHQPPGATGMLAVYRPIDAEDHKGTIDDPIPFVYGMDCYTGKYYSYEGHTYLCKGNMIPCVWPPGTAGLWQWEKVA